MGNGVLVRSLLGQTEQETMNDCSCDYEVPEFFTKETRKAKKRRRCTECRRFIQPGEAYEHVFGKWDGYVSAFETCSICLDIRQHTLSIIPCFCSSYGDLIRDALDELWYYKCENPGAWFKVARLAVTADRLRRGEA